jgi:DNA-binding response OmpR family regulator
VEDDADLRQFNSEVLRRNGYSVETAEDGALAWDALAKRSYDLLITDNRMPKLTGVELLQKLQAASLRVPVIMATGVLPEWEFSQNPEIAPAATLLKPYTIPELLRAVRSILNPNYVSSETVGQPPCGQIQSSPSTVSL